MTSGPWPPFSACGQQTWREVCWVPGAGYCFPACLLCSFLLPIGYLQLPR